MEYIIGAMLLFIIFIIIGLILRKKVYDRVDDLEEWKLAVMNKDVTDELSKIKDLNLSGETQTRFEKWRSDWDHIVTRKMPDLEEELFDAEEAADRYLFRKAKRILDHIHQTLENIETSIDHMFNEVEELISSKEDSHKLVEEVRPRIKETRKYLLQNRYQFGKADIVFDVELDEIEEEIAQFDELTVDGNYIEAQSLVQQVSERLDRLNEKMQEFPTLYHACKIKLPQQLDELTSGLKEMKSFGHDLQHYGYENEIQNYQERLLLLIDRLNKGNLEDVNLEIVEVEERIQEIYDQLEQEALAKQFTEKKIKVMENELFQMDKDFQDMKSEVKTLQENYEFNEEDQETLLSLENQMNQLKLLADKIYSETEKDKKHYANIRGDLENWLSQWENLRQEHEGFVERINSLMQDELEANQQINLLLGAMGQIRKSLQKSNLPGVPEYIYEAMNEVITTIDQTSNQLSQHPLNMEKINHLLAKAEKDIEMVKEQTDYLIEQATLSEYVIQYANRYRSQYPLLAAKLSEAESAFRNWDYEVALETASTALEEIEPGALRRLEGFLNDDYMVSRT
ncbi:septation ring formation regulator [Salinibacillus kushneri]|uniref:Septation ring formation regulator EzrA n=1 Tax=Salinibacillus kushneri TaxID=237682 RepID=A0A1I0HA03_9BACI|nr:septation ring formation regulator EzrA [Salinibacillus kushneri]SET80462.1 septation ring formation regulator [Salinibacillus kushneri]